MGNARLIVLGAVGLFWCAGSVRADYKDQIGFTALKAELGAQTPTGAGVAVVHAEPGVASIDANPTSGEFAGKHFTFIPAAPAAVDGHANLVGTLFYGNSSIAPGISNISHYVNNFAMVGLQTQPILLVPQNYSSNPVPGDTNLDGTVDAVDFNVVTSHFNKPTSNGWSDGDFNLDGFVDNVDFTLMSTNYGKDARTPQLTQPQVSPGRVTNHSYLQWYDTTRRMDWMDATDDTISVVAVNNNETNPPYPGDSGYLPATFNTISVGRSDGLHTYVNATGLGPYVAGRQAPLIVAPESKTSFATPVVSSVAALLVETGHKNPGLSKGSYMSPRTGQTIFHAETLEVIKASLLAGADRSAIGSYTVNTANGMDRRFGAGQVNAYNSYKIMTGGEQDSRERGNLQNIDRTGFDYEPKMTSRGMASYYFTADRARAGIVASLAWNLKIDGGTAPYWNDTATLYHFNLGLYDLTNPASAPVVSNSSIENTQNLFVQNLVRGHNYLMQVAPAAGQSAFMWDYGLAWRFTPDQSIVKSFANGVYQLLAGDANGDGSVDSIDYTTLTGNWGKTDVRWDDGDFNGDGEVNAVDFSLLTSNWSYGTIKTGPLGPLDSLVPEPATLALMLPLLACLALSRKRARMLIAGSTAARHATALE